MTKIIFAIIVGIHALIHLMGLVKAFNWAEIKELALPISKPLGLLWGVACCLFLAALIQYLLKNDYWPVTAFVAVFISQTLVILFWQEAKFGSVINMLILIVSIVAFAQLGFERKVSAEMDALFSQIGKKARTPITSEMVERLPAPVQRWLDRANVIGKEKIYAVRLKQKAQMKMKPEQDMWTEANAEQYFTIDRPAFIWRVNMQMMPFISISGRDKFVDGKGEMLIKILSLFPVADVSGNEKINSGALQRYLAEIVWFPSAALCPYITWQEIDDFSAKATMTYKGTSGSGVFHFDKDGNFVRFSAWRYMGGEENAALKEWIVTVDEIRMMNGVYIPVKMKATWKLESGDWTWLKLEITDIEYNNPSEYNGKEMQ